MVFAGIWVDDVALEEKEGPWAVVAPCLRTLEAGRETAREIRGREASEQLYAPKREWRDEWGAGVVVSGKGG